MPFFFTETGASGVNEVDEKGVMVKVSGSASRLVPM